MTSRLIEGCCAKSLSPDNMLINSCVLTRLEACGCLPCESNGFALAPGNANFWVYHDIFFEGVPPPFFVMDYKTLFIGWQRKCFEEARHLYSVKEKIE